MLGRLLGEDGAPVSTRLGGAKVEDDWKCSGTSVRWRQRSADRWEDDGGCATDPSSSRSVPPDGASWPRQFEAGIQRRSVPFDELPNGSLGLDMGPETQRDFAQTDALRRTCMNGPMSASSGPASPRVRGVADGRRGQRLHRSRRSVPSSARALHKDEPRGPGTTGYPPAAVPRWSSSKGKTAALLHSGGC